MKPLTDEEKKGQIMQILAQKREYYAITILNGLCHAANPKVVATMDKTMVSLDTTGLVEKAVDMADKLLEKLYPIKEEESK